MSEMLTSRQSGPGLVATLPHDVISVVRSGVTISSVGQCVEELVLNSIDANATQIFVGVDFHKFRIRVEDNGNGILKNDLVQIGTRYSTSKCHTLEDLNNLHSYGFRGEALASIIDTADGVELLSRSKSEEFCCRKTFIHGIQDEKIVEGSSSQRKSHGLSVTLVNFMGKFPVQQRRINDSIEIEEIISILERILVMNPLVALEYRNDATDAKILTVSRSPSVAIAFRNIFVQSRHGLALHENLMEAHYSDGVYFLKLYVSKSPHSKHLELVYVNRRYMARGKIHRALHQSLTNLFGFEGKTSATTNEDENNSKHHLTSFAFRSETKTNLNEYPIFILNIECPMSEYDITFDQRKTVVEFKRWNVLMEAMKGLKDRLIMTLKLEANKSIVVSKHSTSKSSEMDSSQCQPIGGSSKGAAATGQNDCNFKDLDGVGKNIATHEMKRTVHSRVAVRGRGSQNEHGSDSDSGQDTESSYETISSSESEENSDVKSSDFNMKIQSKFHLSSRRRTDLEIKSLKRRNTADDTSVLSKKLCILPTKSTQPLARAVVGVLKNIKEFSPWRTMLEGREPSDTIKFLPWRGIPAKRKSTNDDVLSDQLSRLGMPYSDPDSPSPSNDHPKSSTLSRHPDREKSKPRHLVPKKPKTTFEETDDETDHSIQDEDHEDMEVCQKQNPTNFQNKIVKDENLVAGTECSSNGTESADQELDGSRYMYKVLGNHMDTLATTNGCEIQEWGFSAMIRSIQSSPVNSLAQNVEGKELPHVIVTPPSPIHEYDPIQPQRNWDKNYCVPIQDSQYFNPTQSDLVGESHEDAKLKDLEHFEFRGVPLPEFDYIPPDPHSRDSRPFPERHEVQHEGFDSMSDTEYITMAMARLQYTRNAPSPPPFLRDYPQHQTKFLKIQQQHPTTCLQFPGLVRPPPPPPKPSKAKRQVTATVTSATTTGAVNDVDSIPRPSNFTAKPSRGVNYEENSRNSFWDDNEEISVQVQLDLNSYSQDSNAFVPIVPPSPQEFLHQTIEPTSQIEDQIEGQCTNTDQKSVCFSPAIEINRNNTEEMDDDDEKEDEEIASD